MDLQLENTINQQIISGILAYINQQGVDVNFGGIENPPIALPIPRSRKWSDYTPRFLLILKFEDIKNNQML